MNLLTIHIIGWIGMALIGTGNAFAYSGVVKPDSNWYRIPNALGILGVCISAFYERAWQTLALNIFWILVGVVGFIYHSRKKQES